MKRLYEKSELAFALVWIGIFVTLLTAGDGISMLLGIEKVVTLPLTIAMTVVLHVFICKNGLKEKFGLCGVAGSWKNYLFFIPLVLLVSVNLWWGVTMNYSVMETVFYVLAMLCVGYIEEIIFRGFLFTAMAANDVKSAIIVSSVTFGAGHVVNLLNGSPIFDTLLQICYAAAVGLLFTVIFYKGKSLWPCILTHSLVNAVSAFMNQSKVTPLWNILASVFMCVVSLLYAWYIWKKAAGGRGQCVQSAQ